MGPPTIVWDIPIRWPILFLECLRVSRRLGSGGRCYTLEKHAGDNVSKSAFYPTLQLKCSIIFEWFTVLIPRNNLVPGVTSATTPQRFVRRLQFLDVNLCFHMINNWRKFSNQDGMDTTFVMWTGILLCAIHRLFYVNSLQEIIKTIAGIIYFVLVLRHQHPPTHPEKPTSTSTSTPRQGPQTVAAKSSK